MSQREQQTARVNVDDATWQTFRIRAIQAGRSVADELGRLVRNELRGNAPAEPSAPPGTPVPPVVAPARAKPVRAKPAPTSDATLGYHAIAPRSAWPTSNS